MESAVIASAANDRDLQFDRAIESGPEPVRAAMGLDTRETAVLASLGQVSALQMEALNAVAFPLFAVLATGHLVFANLAGKAALRAGQWVRWQGERIVAGQHLCKQHAFASALAGLRFGRSTTTLLTDSATHEQAVLTTIPACTTRTLPNGDAAGLLWVVSATPVAPVSQFARVFDLSRAEERLLQLLMTGAGLREIAIALGISVHTVRNQLKAIFRKTGRRSQAQLLALASRMAMVQGSDLPLGAKPHGLSHRRTP
jgi:DNA-binding CsgD family transcriptional regulator